MKSEHDIHLHAPPSAGEAVTLARRRGIGHADALCDALAETAMLAMARHE